MPHRVIPSSFPPIAVVCLIAGWLNPSSAFGGIYPADAGLIDVTAAPYGAIPDDGLDDTAAIQKALDENAAGDRIIYLPAGTYDISETLFFRSPGSGAARRNIFEGASRDQTVLKLRDNLGFSSAMLQTGNASADHFRNSVRSLTLDIGTGNPQASALQFNASNQGTAQDLLLRSSDPGGAGNIGLDLGFNRTIGPLLVKDVTIEGFNLGIRSGQEANSKVLENITLRNQNEFGWLNSNTATVIARNVVSENRVPAIANIDPVGSDPGNGRMVLIGGQLTNSGDPTSFPAFWNSGAKPFIYVRDLETTGYGQAINRGIAASAGNDASSGNTIEEYWSFAGNNKRRGGTLQLFENAPDTTLGLPIRETPAVAIAPPDQWVSPQDFAIEVVPGIWSGRPNDDVDDTRAIQAAIDSGASTVYLPNGTWTVDETVELRGNVERFLGTEARIESNTRTAAIRLAEGAADTVVVERLSGILGPGAPRVTFEHDSDRTWVFKNVSQWKYAATADAPGDLFLEDVAGGQGGVVFRDQDVWARQWSIEPVADVNDPTLPDAKIVNDNARFWALGLKTEKEGTVVKTINGGMTEVLGLYRNGPGQSDVDNPAIVTEDASASVTLLSIRPNNAGYDILARETRNGVTRDIGSFNNALVYSGFDNDALWEVRQTVHLDNADTQGVTFEGNWSTSSPFPGGFVGEDLAFTTDPLATATFQPDLHTEGLYEISLRWHPDQSNALATSMLISVLTAEGEEELRLNLREGGGQWVSIGKFELAAGAGIGGRVRIFGEGANGVAVADGVRFVLVPEPATMGWAVAVSLMVSRRRQTRSRRCAWR